MEAKTENQSKRIHLNFSGRDEDYAKVIKILDELNNKDYGSKISMVDLMMLSLSKLGPKDFEMMKLSSLSAREKIEIAAKQFNEKNETNLSVEEYICRQLKL